MINIFATAFNKWRSSGRSADRQKLWLIGYQCEITRTRPRYLILCVNEFHEWLTLGRKMAEQRPKKVHFRRHFILDGKVNFPISRNRHQFFEDVPHLRIQKNDFLIVVNGKPFLKKYFLMIFFMTWQDIVMSLFMKWPIQLYFLLTSILIFYRDWC